MTEGAEDYRIFVSRLADDGSWGVPERVVLGGEDSELYPSISPEGGRMVFASYRAVPGDTTDHPNANLWFVDRNSDGSWSTPVFMSAASTLANYDNNPRFRPDGAIEFGSTTPDWSRTDRFVKRWDGTRYGVPETDPLLDAWAGWRDDVSIANATLSPDGALAILDVREWDDEGRLGPSDLWFSRRADGGWSDPEPLAGGVNTPDDFENFAVFSPDGNAIHFVRGFQLYWRIATETATWRLTVGSERRVRPFEDLEDRAGGLEGILPARGDQLSQALLDPLEIADALPDVDEPADRAALHVGAFGDFLEAKG